MSKELTITGLISAIILGFVLATPSPTPQVVEPPKQVSLPETRSSSTLPTKVVPKVVPKPVTVPVGPISKNGVAALPIFGAYAVYKSSPTVSLGVPSCLHDQYHRSRQPITISGNYSSASVAVTGKEGTQDFHRETATEWNTMADTYIDLEPDIYNYNIVVHPTPSEIVEVSGTFTLIACQ